VAVGAPVARGLRRLLRPRLPRRRARRQGRAGQAPKLAPVVRRAVAIGALVAWRLPALARVAGASLSIRRLSIRSLAGAPLSVRPLEISRQLRTGAAPSALACVPCGCGGGAAAAAVRVDQHAPSELRIRDLAGAPLSVRLLEVRVQLRPGVVSARRRGRAGQAPKLAPVARRAVAVGAPVARRPPALERGAGALQ
jgi:hypothetical protein